MALIRLQDIGKIYVSEGNVAVGIRGVNLSFESGEFVAITGASGSGKSTLLNVISGMDSYEEGELYVNGQPTSHYVQEDWEEYRKNYISFIFQEYNIVDSFTVLQNVELALMHIKNIPERRKRALELIEKVGMTDHIHHKGSKLSGGQKQRTVIARALAKDSPIILADEPTGNLDSKSSEEIINLLREISANKLVIIVTHNFEEVEHCATRVIRVFDGAIESDTRLTENIVSPASDEVPANGVSDTSPASGSAKTGSTSEEPTDFQKVLDNLRNGLHLGWVRFLSKPKLAVFLSLLMLISVLGSVLNTSISSEALTFKKTVDIFTHVDGRLIITAKDGKPITDDKVEELAKKVSAKSYMHYDYLLDNTISTYVTDGDLLTKMEYVCRTEIDVKPTIGRFPTAVDEVMLSVPISTQNIYGKDSLKVTTIDNLFDGVTYKIVGIHYFYDNTKSSVAVFTPEGYELATKFSLFCSNSFGDYTNGTTDISGTISEKYVNESGVENESKIQLSKQNLVITLDLPAESYYFVPPVGSTLKSATGTLMYYYSRPYSLFSDSYLSISSTYTLDATQCLTTLPAETLDSLPSGATAPGTLIIGLGIVNKFMDEYFKEGYLQASLFFENDRSAKAAIPMLRELGYFATMSDATRTMETLEIISSLIQVIFQFLLWFLVLCFIAMFLNLCSKKAMLANTDDIAIMRSMGITGKIIHISIYVQTLLAVIPALIISAITFSVIYLIPKTNAIFPFLHAREYILVLVGVLIISLRMAKRFVKKMFSSSVKKTLKGGLEK